MISPSFSLRKHRPEMEGLSRMSGVVPARRNARKKKKASSIRANKKLIIMSRAMMAELYEVKLAGTSATNKKNNVHSMAPSYWTRQARQMCTNLYNYSSQKTLVPYISKDELILCLLHLLLKPTYYLHMNGTTLSYGVPSLCFYAAQTTISKIDLVDAWSARIQINFLTSNS